MEMTNEAEPGPVTGLNASALSANTIEVTWNEPTEPNGVLGDYR